MRERAKRSDSSVAKGLSLLAAGMLAGGSIERGIDQHFHGEFRGQGARCVEALDTLSEEILDVQGKFHEIVQDGRVDAQDEVRFLSLGQAIQNIARQYIAIVESVLEIEPTEPETPSQRIKT